MTTQKPEEKNNVPWRIAFTRKDLLTASWGSKKGADLLYHLLNKASWSAKDQKLAEDVTTVRFQEERPKLFEAIEKSGSSLSQGSYNTLLRAFIEVGYVVARPYSDVYEVHTDVIKTAFSNPPQKPVRGDNKDDHCVKMTHRHTDTISREEYISLQENCVNLSKLCQNLSIQVAELTQLCQSLTQNTSGSKAQQNGSKAICNPLICFRDNANAFFGEQDCQQDSHSDSAEEKKEEPPAVFHMTEWLAELDVKIDALTEECCSKLQPPKVLSTIPDVPPMAFTAKQIEAQRKHRMADIMVLADQEVGARVPRSPKKFVQEAIEDLVDGDYSDAQIVFSIQDLKARNRDLTFTEIAKNMANAVNKLKNNLPPGILAFKPQPPPQETRLAPRTKDMSHLGDHLNPADYDEEVFIYRPVRRG